MESQEAESTVIDPFGDAVAAEAQDVDFTNPEGKEPESPWVRLTSQDGFSYIVKRDIAKASGTIKNMLEGMQG